MMTTRADPIQLTTQLMSIDSTSGREGDVIAWLEPRLVDMGWRTRRIPVSPGRDDLYATTAGRGGRTRAVLRDVLVVSASAGDGDAVATLRVPERFVPVLVAAEGRSSLRLVVRAPEQM